MQIKSNKCLVVWTGSTGNNWTGGRVCMALQLDSALARPSLTPTPPSRFRLQSRQAVMVFPGARSFPRLPRPHWVVPAVFPEWSAVPRPGLVWPGLPMLCCAALCCAVLWCVLYCALRHFASLPAVSPIRPSQAILSIPFVPPPLELHGH